MEGNNNSIYYELFQLEYYLQRRVDEYLFSHGLDEAGYQFLAYIGAHGGCRVGDVEAAVQMDRAAVNRKLRALGERGFVMKRGSRSDRRIILLYLTPAGRAVTSAVREILKEWDDEMHRQLGEQDCEALSQIIERLAEATRHEQAQPAPQPTHDGLHHVKIRAEH
ncbi:MarR family winged helix-turn-helix transcriptional regulator [Provencibacterium massiliense]|uniref:MarR family winged helix-turn-helix transcriptional regulator n=1 Tax=Provencibacterium massiliense TaxID=1841868 RepID=UPI001356696A|nr:MarR family winged helix-turn-helix transcriptional regulator [Provencibacterium massiliense]